MTPLAPPRAADLGPLAPGTVEFGSTLWQDHAFRLLDRFADLGGRLVDTAPIYGSSPGGLPQAESIIGRWLARTGGPLRIATKAGIDPTDPARGRLDPRELLSSALASRDRLRVERLDIFLLHRDDPSVPLADVAAALHHLVADGIAARVGCSNWHPRRLRALAAHMAAAGQVPLSATQPLWSLARRCPGAPEQWLVEADAAHLEFAGRAGVLVMPYRATALGFFSGRYHDHRGGRFAEHVRCTYQHRTNLARLDRARNLAARLGTTAHAVAIAFLRSFDIPAVPIVGATHPGQLQESFAGAALDLSTAERQWLTNGALL